jgi:hypothetical protein
MGSCGLDRKCRPTERAGKTKQAVEAVLDLDLDRAEHPPNPVKRDRNRPIAVRLDPFATVHATA